MELQELEAALEKYNLCLWIMAVLLSCVIVTGGQIRRTARTCVSKARIAWYLVLQTPWLLSFTWRSLCQLGREIHLSLVAAAGVSNREKRKTKKMALRSRVRYGSASEELSDRR